MCLRLTGGIRCRDLTLLQQKQNISNPTPYPVIRLPVAAQEFSFALTPLDAMPQSMVNICPQRGQSLRIGGEAAPGN